MTASVFATPAATFTILLLPLSRPLLVKETVSLPAFVIVMPSLVKVDLLPAPSSITFLSAVDVFVLAPSVIVVPAAVVAVDLLPSTTVLPAALDVFVLPPSV